MRVWGNVWIGYVKVVLTVIVNGLLCPPRSRTGTAWSRQDQ